MPRPAFILGLLLLAAAALGAEGLPEASQTFRAYPGSTTTVQTLDNGLTVIHTEDRAQRYGHVLVWVRSGSADEAQGSSGVSRLVEFLMKGPLKRDAPDFRSQSAAFGARPRSETSAWQTLYSADLEPAALAAYLSADGRRFQRLRADPQTLDSDKAALDQELALEALQDPLIPVKEALFAAAFADSSLAWPTSGLAQDRSGLGAQDCEDYLRARYRPGACAVLINGPFSRQDALSWAQTSFGTWAAGLAARTTATAAGDFHPGLRKAPESERLGPRLLVGLRLPGNGLRPGSAEDLLAHILFSSRSAALARSGRLRAFGILGDPRRLDAEGPSPLLTVLLELAPQADPHAALAGVEGLSKEVASLSPEAFEDYRREWCLDARDRLTDPAALDLRLGQAWSQGGLPLLIAQAQGQDLPGQAEVAALAQRMLAPNQVAALYGEAAP